MDVVYRPFGPSPQPNTDELLHHLERVGQLTSSVSIGMPNSFGFTAELGGKVIGHILLLEQEIRLPHSGSLHLLNLSIKSMREAFDEEVREAFVQSFAVDKNARRKGIGTKLQMLAIEACRKRGLNQMRSWSSLGATDNYRIKLRLGFSISPGYQYVPKLEQWAPGCYFVLTLKPQTTDS